MRSSDGQKRGDPVIVFGPGRGTEGQGLAYKRRNRGTCVAPRCGLSDNSRSVPPCGVRCMHLQCTSPLRQLARSITKTSYKLIATKRRELYTRYSSTPAWYSQSRKSDSQINRDYSIAHFLLCRTFKQIRFWLAITYCRI
jgi:hypothetical protein